MTVCTRCGRANEPHYKFCLSCGVELTGVPGPAPGPGPLAVPPAGSMPDEPATRLGAPPLSAPQQPTADTVPCRHCGAAVVRGFAFCGACGTRLPGSTSAWAGPEEPQPVPEADPAGRRAIAQLVRIEAGGQDGGAITIFDGETPVGRAYGGAMFQSDAYLSPRHCTFFSQGSRLYARDERSLNGVYLRVRGEVLLQPGDTLRLGQELLRFDALDLVDTQRADDGTLLLGSPEPGCWGRLVEVMGPEEVGNAYMLRDPEIVLGRAYGDILFPGDVFVSGTHARLSNRQGRVVLSDLGSSNGTYLRVRGEASVEDGDFLLLGQQLFQVRVA